MRADAFAKVNLGLRVAGGREGGLHPVEGLFQSIDWPDSLALEASEEDVITAGNAGTPIDGWDNLAWRAVKMARERAGSERQMRLDVHKRIPVASGLGGGSADAAAGLALAGRWFRLDEATITELAPQLGSDVPFCLRGGLAVVSGTGERVSPLPPVSGYALGLVVPPVEVVTARVYAAWDLLEEPKGPEVSGRELPPGLREYGPLANDLFPAAVSLAPAIEEWRAELSARWNRPVMLTGSGPTLLAYFVDTSEAEEALDAVPVGARATRAARPVDRGWRLDDREHTIEDRDSE